jgi:hypothetical protein
MQKPPAHKRLGPPDLPREEHGAHANRKLHGHGGGGGAVEEVLLRRNVDAQDGDEEDAREEGEGLGEVVEGGLGVLCVSAWFVEGLGADRREVDGLNSFDAGDEQRGIAVMAWLGTHLGSLHLLCPRNVFIARLAHAPAPPPVRAAAQLFRPFLGIRIGVLRSEDVCAAAEREAELAVSIEASVASLLRPRAKTAFSSDRVRVSPLPRRTHHDGPPYRRLWKRSLPVLARAWRHAHRYPLGRYSSEDLTLRGGARCCETSSAESPEEGKERGGG